MRWPLLVGGGGILPISLTHFHPPTGPQYCHIETEEEALALGELMLRLGAFGVVAAPYDNTFANSAEAMYTIEAKSGESIIVPLFALLAQHMHDYFRTTGWFGGVCAVGRRWDQIAFHCRDDSEGGAKCEGK